MASTLASQLQKIADTSTSTLSARKQKSIHSASLLFPASHAAAQDFETIYSIALEGFLELVQLDGRFAVFQRGIFSESSKDVDRLTMTKAENDDLDASCKAFLELVGKWARLKPALKAIEWLVRRFRVNIYIPVQLILTFLPHFQQPIFRIVLSIIPQKHFPRPFSFLQSYTKSETAPPRSLFTHALATRPDLFAILSDYTVELLKTGRDYPLFIKFWASISVEAIAMMCERTRSTSNKKSSSTNETEEDVITKVLPILAEGLKGKHDPEFQLACYMVIAVLTAKLHELDERVLTGLVEAVVGGLTEDTVQRGLACVGILIQEGGRLSLPCAQRLLKLDGLEKHLATLSTNLRIDRLAAAIVHLVLENITTSTTSDIDAIEFIIAEVRMSQKQKKNIFVKIAKQAQTAELEQNPEVANRFTELVVNIAQGTPAGKTGRKKLAALFSETLEEEKVDVDVLELKLGSAIKQVSLDELTPQAENVAKKEEKTKGASLEGAVKALPESVPENFSFLKKSSEEIFSKAVQAFTLSVPNEAATKSLLQHSIFSSQTALHSFLARLWTGEYPTLVRVSALQHSREAIEAAIASKTTQDYQALLPYVFLALSDNARKERQEASLLLSTLHKAYKNIIDAKRKSKAKVWGFESLYEDNKTLDWIVAADASKFIDSLEAVKQECVLDDSVITRVLRNILSSSKYTSDSNVEPLKKSVRSGVLGMLCSHVITTQFYPIKLRLLRILSEVNNTTASRATLLAPAFKAWTSMGPNDTRKRSVAMQGVDPVVYEQEIFRIVAKGDKSEAVDMLVEVLKNSSDPAVQDHAAQRIREIWSSLKHNVKTHVTEQLFKIAFGDLKLSKATMAEAAGLLRDLEIPRDNFDTVLEDILAALKRAVPKNATDPKRKKVEKDGKNTAVVHAISNATIALESLANNKVKEEDGSLINVLFNILQELLSAESESGVRIAYVTSLVLDCLLEMIKKVKDGKIPSDLASSVRAEVIVSCIRTSSSPQIHNTALLICAAIADVAPEAVLHSVMPIFTFMGANVLRQDDEYSVYVIEQTIKRIIPPLLRSLQAQGESPVVGAAELLSSFIAAFVHVPVHRRQWLYTTLIEALGPEDFLFALVSMLAEKYGTSLDSKTAYRSKSVEKESLKGFCLDVMAHFSTTTQLSAVNMCLQVVRDLLEPKQDGVAQKLFNPRKAPTSQFTSTPEDAVTNILDVLSTVLASDILKAQIARNLKASSNTNEQVRTLFTQSLEEILLLAAKYSDSEVSTPLAKTLGVFLGILATGEFVKVIESLIENKKEQLCQIAMGTLRSRVLSEHRLDATARASLVSLAPKISSIIASSGSVDLKLQCLLCSDAIILKCGKQEPNTVIALATTIVEAGALKSGEKALQVAALVSLSSSVSCLGGRFIPLIPKSVPYALDLIKNDASSEMHTAAFAYLDELIQAVPSFMSSHLPALLQAAAKASTLDLSDDVDEVKSDLLKSVAEKTELKNIIKVVSSIWDEVVKYGEEALTELVTVLKNIVIHSTKSQVQKLSSEIKDFLLKALDLRRSAQLDDEDTDSVEQLILETILQVIYKLNDVIFRPMFTDILDWAAVKTKKDPSSRERRLVTFWNFMHTLSESLKSLFTDYFGIALPNAIEVLTAASQSKKLDEGNPKTSYARVLAALHSSFTHDEKDFWHLHFPSLITPLLSLLPALPSTTIPPLLALLSCAQSEDNFKTVNTALLKLMRDDENTAVRVAGTRALAEIYGALGEDWIGLLPETVPVLAEVLEDENESVESAVRELVKNVEKVLGEGELEGMLT